MQNFLLGLQRDEVESLEIYTRLTKKESIPIIALLIITIFNFYISVAKNYNFKKRFSEMACISMGVVFMSFGTGWMVKTFLGLEVRLSLY